tara:strand:+ start:1172 stop:1360 length:189 start_codon:yes stop_codon:yes gene_type:complete
MIVNRLFFNLAKSLIKLCNYQQNQLIASRKEEYRPMIQNLEIGLREKKLGLRSTLYPNKIFG